MSPKTVAGFTAGAAFGYLVALYSQPLQLFRITRVVDDESVATVHATAAANLHKEIERLKRQLSEARAVRHVATEIEDPRIGSMSRELEDVTSGSVQGAASSQTPQEVANSLIALGVSSVTAERIRQRIGEQRMALLDLRDRATREGWMDTPEFRDQLDEIADPFTSVRAEFGDSVYDNYLYATNRANRIRVADVYPDSNAQFAGIEPGDVIVGYDSENIYEMAELKKLTGMGQSGQPVLIELRRTNNTVFAVVPRGPLGVMMSAERMAPVDIRGY